MYNAPRFRLSRAFTVLLALAGATAHANEPEAPNTLTASERAAGWQLLWDGHSTAGWQSARGGGFPQHDWVIRDGELRVEPSGGKEGGEGGDIISTRSFSDFELTVDFKLFPGSNSGIKYFVDPGLNRGPGSAIGLEYQLLDDARHPDAKLGRNGDRTCASLYDLIPAPKDKPIRPIGEWNTARIVSRGAHVEHWLNGRKVLEYDRFTPEFRQLVAESKYKIWPNFGELKSGPILLQDHGDAVSFRNIKIRPLNTP